MSRKPKHSKPTLSDYAWLERIYQRNRVRMKPGQIWRITQEEAEILKENPGPPPLP